MATRQTMNVSFTPAQERFVRSQVDSGRYRSASEVVRHGLRLLEESAHRRLLEQWLMGEIGEDQLPPEVRQRATARLRAMIDEGVRSAKEHGWTDEADVKNNLTARRRNARSA